MTYDQLPRVYLFGTGGTISFVAESRTDFANYSYQGRQLTIQEMLARVPEAQDVAEVLPEQVINVGSTEVYPQSLAHAGESYQPTTLCRRDCRWSGCNPRYRHS